MRALAAALALALAGCTAPPASEPEVVAAGPAGDRWRVYAREPGGEVFVADLPAGDKATGRYLVLEVANPPPPRPSTVSLRCPLVGRRGTARPELGGADVLACTAAGELRALAVYGCPAGCLRAVIAGPYAGARWCTARWSAEPAGAEVTVDETWPTLAEATLPAGPGAVCP